MLELQERLVCHHFDAGRCGSCTWLPRPYGDQLAAKHEQAVSLLDGPGVLVWLENGVEYEEITVANDALTVVANPENDWCDCLTVEELTTGPTLDFTRQIYGSVVTDSVPVYSEGRFRWVDREYRWTKRLHLPLSRDGGAVDMVLAGGLINPLRESLHTTGSPQ